MKFTNINEARAFYTDWVIIWYQHQIGGQIKDRWMWMAEKNGEVVDYHHQVRLISDAKKRCEKVVVLCLHRNGQITAKEENGGA